MIKIENVKVTGFEDTIRGMRNPMNSWAKSDSGICKGGDDGIGCTHCADYICDHEFDGEFHIGVDDYKLMLNLARAGSVDGKYRRMIVVYMDITAPLYWWKEFDTYKVGTVANSCSTMHKIHAKEFTRDDFSHDKLDDIWEYEPEVRDMAPVVEFETQTDKETNYVLGPYDILDLTIKMLNRCRELFLKTKDKRYWWQMIQLLPSSYNQRRTVMVNYEVLANMHKGRWNHKLDEWHTFCGMIRSLPYSGLITCSTRDHNFAMKGDE